MPRGRSKDATLPLTRQLTAQRDYRARKAARLQTLQDQVEHLTAENQALVAELTSLRAKLSDPERLTAAQESAVDAARAELVNALYRLEAIHPSSASNNPKTHPNGNVNSHPNIHPIVPTPAQTNGLSNGNGVPHANGSGYTQPNDQPRPERQYALSMSPSNSISTNGETPPPRAMPVFDPNCCDGLFDCSGLPGLPVSDMRTQGAAPFVPAPPGPPQPEQRYHQPPPHMHPPPPITPPKEDCCLGLVDCEPTVQ